ncbi:hypothetical protein KCU92_g1098, partial [Aureobasidium melanogenum]
MNASTLGWDDIFFFPFFSLLIFSYTGQPYLKVTMLSPIASSTLQATAIAATSNVIAQLLEQRSKQTASGFSVPDFLRFVIFTLLTAPPNYLWQHALERVFPGRKPLNPTKTILPHYEIREHDNLSGEDGLQQQEEPETKLDWKNTMIKWFIDCITLGALLNTGVFIIIMGIMKGRSMHQIGNALRTAILSTFLKAGQRHSATCASLAVIDLKLEVLKLHSMDMFNGPSNRHTLFEVPVKWQGKEQIREGLDEAIRKIDMLNGAEEYEVVILEVGKRFVKLMEQSNGDRRESA